MYLQEKLKFCVRHTPFIERVHFKTAETIHHDGHVLYSFLPVAAPQGSMGHLPPKIFSPFPPPKKKITNKLKLNQIL